MVIMFTIMKIFIIIFPILRLVEKVRPHGQGRHFASQMTPRSKIFGIIGLYMEEMTLLCRFFDNMFLISL